MARQLSAEEFQELGRNYYKQKQYDKALETFTKGIETCQKPTVTLYDYRAATYDKLERLNQAVKDGREMIRLDKADVKGYLRTASVLEKMGKEETALEIYKYGMKNVGIKDKNFKLLQQLHDKLTRKLSPATAVDPFSVLPVELAEIILEYLPFRNIVNCMRVSKGWHTYFSRMSKLWLHLDLRGARKPVSRSFVNSAFKYSDLRMTSVTLHRFEHMDVVRNLAKAAKELTTMEIISLPHAVSASLVHIVNTSLNLKKLVVYPDMTADAVEQILETRPQLEHVDFHSVVRARRPMKWTKTFAHLHTLSLSFVEKTPASNLELIKLLSLTPSLQSLSLCNLKSFQTTDRAWPQHSSQLPRLTKLVLKRVQLVHPLALPGTLQHLDLDNDGGPIAQSSHHHICVQDGLPDLTHVSLSGFLVNPATLTMLLDMYIHDGALESFPGGKPLQHLSFRCLISTDPLFAHGPTAMVCVSPRVLTPALESLDMATMACTDDEVEKLLTYQTAGLKSIDLSDTQVTGASVKMLVDKLPLLKHIRVDNCTRISGRDAIEYAERKGVAVSYRMVEQKGAKRTRYG